MISGTRSSAVRRTLLGGFTAGVLAISAVAFAGEAAALPPRGNSQDRACTSAEAAQAGRDAARFDSLAREAHSAYQISGNITFLHQAYYYVRASEHAAERCHS